MSFNKTLANFAITTKELTSRAIKSILYTATKYSKLTLILSGTGIACYGVHDFKKSIPTVGKVAKLAKDKCWNVGKGPHLEITKIEKSLDEYGQEMHSAKFLYHYTQLGSLKTISYQMPPRPADFDETGCQRLEND